MNQRRGNDPPPPLIQGKSDANLARVSRREWFRKRLPNLTKSFAYAGVIAIVDLVVLLALMREMSSSILTLILFLEGGIGLLAGVGISLSSSPSMSRLGEELFHSSPWSREAERHAEGVGLKWMLTAAFLVLLGFAISAI